MSPALELLDLVWRKNARTSWRVINESMQVALRLAIEGGFEFQVTDFAYIAAHWNPGYWMGCDGMETAYARACSGPHGPNRSAIRAIEEHLGRKAFICPARASGDPLIRLYVGAKFDWHDGMKKGVRGVEVTRFSKAGDVDCVNACSYKPGDKDGYEPRKVDRLFKITHADISAFRKAIREFNKKRDAENAELETAAQ